MVSMACRGSEHASVKLVNKEAAFAKAGQNIVKVEELPKEKKAKPTGRPEPCGNRLIERG